MKYFSVPADFKKETIDRYHEMNSRYEDSKVLETYGQITLDNSLESGRQVNCLPQVNLDALEKYVAFSRARGIDFNYTINGTHMGNKEFTGDGVYDIKKFLYQLYEAGVRSLTVTLPSVMELVQSTRLDFKIKASVLCQITNANKAASFKKIGVDRMVLDESINRDFQTLNEIVKIFGDKVELIANVVCFKDCIYRMFHYNQMASDSLKVTSKASTEYYSHRCMLKRYEDIENILKLNWIRPEDLKYYTATGIHYFKLQGRQAVLKGDPVRAVECYFKESYEGNLLELLDMFAPTNSFTVFVDNQKLDGYIEPFYKQKGFCRRNCSECKYCRNYIEKCIDYAKAREIAAQSNMFYRECDSFTQLIGDIRYEEKEKDLLSADTEILKQENDEFGF